MVPSTSGTCLLAGQHGFFAVITVECGEIVIDESEGQRQGADMMRAFADYLVEAYAGFLRQEIHKRIWVAHEVLRDLMSDVQRDMEKRKKCLQIKNKVF